MDAPFNIQSLRAPPAERSLPARYPQLAAELHQELNGDLRAIDLAPGTSIKVWWTCDRGHVWQASVISRVRGSGCPHCSRSRAAPGRSLADAHPELVAELIPDKNPGIDPARLTPGSNQAVWWRCTRGHDWRARVFSRTAGSGCPVCSRTQVAPQRSLALLHPALAGELHPDRNDEIDPSTLAARSNLRLWWRCADGHEWQARVTDRVAGTGCPACYRAGRGTRASSSPAPDAR